ncbi:MAG: hypothetical protein ABSH53_18040 [Holophaga sp.]|jgi:hypothetical protein
MSLSTLPPHSRLWLLALRTPPDPDVEARLRQGLQEIITHWRHKGQAYQGAGVLLEPQLLAVAEPTLAAQPSGCAIDGMLRRVHRLVESLGLALVDPGANILVRLDGRLVPIPKDQIQARLDDGTLTGTTPVLDLSLYSLQDLRDRSLERPLAGTWVGRRYRMAVDA